jgi:cbb3-type cytochrome oxidase subunit 1
MNPQLKKLSIPILRWTLGLVVLWQSIHFVLSASSTKHLSESGMPQWIRPALGGSEIVAALLFLMPAVSWIGGYSLLAIFAIAMVLHRFHGDADVGGLILYCAVVLVCLSHLDQKRVETPDER